MGETAGIQVYYNRLKMFLTLCPSILIFVGINWWWFGSGAHSRAALDLPQVATVATIVYVGLTVVCVLALLFIVYMVTRPEPYLLINELGIRMTTPLLSMFIPWTEIQELTTRRSLWSYLAVVPRRTEHILDHLNGWQRFNMRMNFETFGGAIPVGNFTMSIPPAKLLTQTSQRYGDELEQYGVRITPRGRRHQLA